MAAAGRSDIRAAASSMPSGRPSRSAQISAMTAASAAGSQPGPDGPGPFDEQADRRRVAGPRPRPWPVGSGRTGYSCSPLRCSGDRLATMKREPGELRRSVATIAGRVEDVLEVVEDQEHRPLGEEAGQRVDGLAQRPVEEAERPGDGRADLVRVVERVERDEPGAVGHVGCPSRERARPPGSSCRCRRARSG